MMFSVSNKIGRVLLMLLSVVQSVVSLQLTVQEQYSPLTEDAWVCVAYKLDDSITYHLKHFQANYKRMIKDGAVHHLALGVCDEPGSEEPYWNCNDRLGSKQIEPGLPIAYSCKEHPMLTLYGWAYGSHDLTLPDDYAYEVGKDTRSKYLILQSHYANIKAGQTDLAEIRITYDVKPKSNTTTISFDASHTDPNSVIPPHQITTLEGYREVPVVIHPLVYQVHSHFIGVNISAYVVKRGQGNDGLDKWIRLGKRDPRLPQDYIPVENQVPIVPGDGIAVRCTYNNDRDYAVKIGAFETQEMCEVAVTGWYDSADEDKITYEEVDMNHKWSEIPLTNIPQDA